MRTRLVWLLVGISAACAVADTLIVAAFQPLLSEASIAVHGWPLVPAASLGSSVMGAVILTRFPRHPIGWLLNIVGVTSSISILGEAYSIWVIEEGGPGSHLSGVVAGWLAALLGGPLALAAMAVMFLVAPDGRLLSPRWKFAVWAAAGGLALFVVGLSIGGSDSVAGRGTPDAANTQESAIITIGVVAITVALLSAVVSMLLRLRRAHGDTRQQLRWFATAAALIGLGVLALVVGQAITDGKQTWGTAIPLQVSFFLLPICLAIAILRYRLYDIDVIISRAVVVGLATLFAAAGYIALVVGVGELLGSRSDRFWLSVLATAVVAMAFQPLRKWVVLLADRLAYGTRSVPYDTLADFSRRLGESPAPESLLPAVAEAAGRAVSAHEVRVSLDVEQGAPLTVVWTTERAEPLAVTAADLVMVEISDRGGRLGEMSVRLRPTQVVTEQERLLLDDLAEQTALAFRNLRLQTELSAHVAALDEQTAELAASRRRMIDAGDAERRRIEAAIAREVMPTLEALTVALEDDTSEPSPDELVERATQALDSLRELTHGIFPTMLARAGLGPALASYLSRGGRAAAVLHVDDSAKGRRFSDRIEAAAYFCCVSASQDTPVRRISLKVVGTELVLEVDGATVSGSDRAPVVDRVEALGGALQWGSGLEPGLTARLPVEVDDEAIAPALPGRA